MQSIINNPFGQKIDTNKKTEGETDARLPSFYRLLTLACIRLENVVHPLIRETSSLHQGIRVIPQTLDPRLKIGRMIIHESVMLDTQFHAEKSCAHLRDQFFESIGLASEVTHGLCNPFPIETGFMTRPVHMLMKGGRPVERHIPESTGNRKGDRIRILVVESAIPIMDDSGLTCGHHRSRVSIPDSRVHLRNLDSREGVPGLLIVENNAGVKSCKVTGILSRQVVLMLADLEPGRSNLPADRADEVREVDRRSTLSLPHGVASLRPLSKTRPPVISPMSGRSHHEHQGIENPGVFALSIHIDRENTSHVCPRTMPGKVARLHPGDKVIHNVHDIRRKSAHVIPYLSRTRAQREGCLSRPLSRLSLVSPLHRKYKEEEKQIHFFCNVFAQVQPRQM